MVNVAERPRERALSRDWTNQTNAILNDAKATRTTSTKLRGQATATRRAIDKQTKEQQATVDDALRKKVADTTCLKNKIEKRITAIQAEMDKLCCARDRGMSMVLALVKPIHKTENRLQLRERRPSREKIFDKVEKSLGTELEELRRAHAQLEGLVKETDAHIALMNECRQTLRSDHTDKTHSLKLDMACLDLPAKAVSEMTQKVCATARAAPQVPHLPGIGDTAPASKSTTLPSLWRQNTERNINEACKLEHESSDTRKKIINIIHQVEEVRHVTHLQVQEALGHKVKQTTNLQNKLNQNLLDINTELNSLDEQKQNVLRALQAKEVPLQIVKERLALRKTRPTRETVRDSVEEALESEQVKLSNAIKQLQTKLMNIDQEREHLLQAQRHIGQDIKDKASSLSIDKKCLDLDQQSSSTLDASVRSDQSNRTPLQRSRNARAEDFRKGGHMPRPPAGHTSRPRGPPLA